MKHGINESNESNESLELIVGFRILSLASWFLFLFFAGAASFALLTQQYVLLPGLLAVSCYGLFVLFYFGEITLDKKSIRQSTLSGKYEILWSETKQIELSVSQYTTTFIGDNKILSIVGPYCIQSRDLEEFVQFIVIQAEANNIVIKEKASGFRFPKNTKVVR